MSEQEQRGLFVPLFILSSALVIWFGFQTSQLVTERSNLKTLHQNQEAIYQNAQKMRGQLDAIAAGTQRLANAGNPNAAQIVNALRARGITINPNAPTGQAPATK
jgi:cell division protein FtsL